MVKDVTYQVVGPDHWGNMRVQGFHPQCLSFNMDTGVSRGMAGYMPCETLKRLIQAWADVLDERIETELFRNGIYLNGLEPQCPLS